MGPVQPADSQESLYFLSTSQDGQQRRTAAFSLAMGAVNMGFLMSSIDTVIVGSAPPKFETALHASSIQAYWCGTGLMYAAAVAQAMYGAFIPVFGAAGCIQSAMGMFLAASIFCAAAQSIGWLIAARVVRSPKKVAHLADIC